MNGLLDRIERVPVGSLTPHPRNARRGNVELIAESLAENDQYAPLIVQASTRHILAGNHTWRAAQSLGWEHVDVAIVDVDDERAVKIMLASNRTADVGGYDETLLAELLAELPDLEGTGYSTADLDEIAAALTAPAEPLPGPDLELPDDVDERAHRCPKCGYAWA